MYHNHCYITIQLTHSTPNNTADGSAVALLGLGRNILDNNRHNTAYAKQHRKIRRQPEQHSSGKGTWWSLHKVHFSPVMRPNIISN